MDCRDRERVLRDQEPEGLAALAAHAETCPACREELASWEAIGEAARQLRRDWDSPRLWPRIAEALEAEPRRRPRPVALRLAVAASLLIATATVLVLRERAGPPESADPAERRLLTERALAEVEDAETAYVRSIEALATLAEPRLERADSPLLMSYREKLALIDAAIAECRAQVEGNRANAHLRQELLSVYREKQRTLEQLLKEDLDAVS
jgi:hypothetical protein